MLRFEIKKIFSRTRNRVAVAFLLVVLVVVSMLTVNMVEYTDENGESSTGIAAARELRADERRRGETEFYVSDRVEDFERTASLFLQEDLRHTARRIDIERY